MRSNFYLMVILSLLCAFLLQIYPLYGEWRYWRPCFVLMVTAFWLLHEPFRFGIGSAWGCGLALDVITGGLYGAQALAFSICAYLLQMSVERMLHFRVWHQAGVIMVLVLISQLVVLSLNLLLRDEVSKAMIFYPAIVSALCWIPLCMILNRFYRPLSTRAG